MCSAVSYGSGVLRLRYVPAVSSAVRHVPACRTMNYSTNYQAKRTHQLMTYVSVARHGIGIGSLCYTLTSISIPS